MSTHSYKLQGKHEVTMNLSTVIKKQQMEVKSGREAVSLFQVRFPVVSSLSTCRSLIHTATPDCIINLQLPNTHRVSNVERNS